MTNKTYIDLSTYARRAHFEYFSSLQNPTMGATVQVNLTKFMTALEAGAYPFFLSFLYCVADAVNAVKELRQRIEEGKIVEYEYCKPSCTVMKPDGTYAYCTLDARLPLEQFLKEGKAAMEQAKQGGTLEESDEVSSEIFISCLPWLHYESLVQPMGVPADSNVRITWGKYAVNEGKTVIPVTFLAHHALVDGVHMSCFYEKLAENLERFPALHNENERIP